MIKYKGLLKPKDLAYYVSDSQLIDFITKNSKMDENEVCDYVRENDIVSEDGRGVLWTKKDVLNKKEHQYYNPNAIEWMTKFFEAHPFIERVMVVFDD
jgi:hypothetical protein